MYRNAISRAGPNEMLSNMHEWFSTMQLMLPISYIADLDAGRQDNKKNVKKLEPIYWFLLCTGKTFQK